MNGVLRENFYEFAKRVNDITKARALAPVPKPVQETIPPVLQIKPKKPENFLFWDTIIRHALVKKPVTYKRGSNPFQSSQDILCLEKENGDWDVIKDKRYFDVKEKTFGITLPVTGIPLNIDALAHYDGRFAPYLFDQLQKNKIADTKVVEIQHVRNSRYIKEHKLLLTPDSHSKLAELALKQLANPEIGAALAHSASADAYRAELLTKGSKARGILRDIIANAEFTDETMQKIVHWATTQNKEQSGEYFEFAAALRDLQKERSGGRHVASIRERDSGLTRG